MNMQKYSVLMSVYAKEKPEFLRESMMSMYEQTVLTDDFVLVCDGPLNDGLDKVIEEMQKEFGERLRVIRLSENHGLGYALNLGVKKCKNDLIARMDSDDVAVRNRCERELEVFKNKPECSVVGGYVAEFEGDIKNAKFVRKVPEHNKAMIGFAKLRSPFNHPTVMFKKKDILAAGNYRDVRFCQDYFLWVKVLASNCMCYNIQDILVYMREDKNSFKRRSGMEYFKIQKQLNSEMRSNGLITNTQYMSLMVLRFGSTHAPNWLRRMLYTKIMREAIR